MANHLGLRNSVMPATPFMVEPCGEKAQAKQSQRQQRRDKA
jgi:hypothetical protein